MHIFTSICMPWRYTLQWNNVKLYLLIVFVILVRPDSCQTYLIKLNSVDLPDYANPHLTFHQLPNELSLLRTVLNFITPLTCALNNYIPKSLNNLRVLMITVMTFECPWYKEYFREFFVFPLPGTGLRAGRLCVRSACMIERSFIEANGQYHYDIFTRWYILLIYIALCW